MVTVGTTTTTRPSLARLTSGKTTSPERSGCRGTALPGARLAAH